MARFDDNYWTRVGRQLGRELAQIDLTKGVKPNPDALPARNLPVPYLRARRQGYLETVTHAEDVL